MKLNKFIISAFVLGSLLSPSAAFATATAYAQTGFDDPLEAGNVAIEPNLQASSPTIAGGALPLGGSAQIVALFKNSGNEPVIIGDINLYTSSSVTAQVAMNQCSSSPLTPGAECAITVEVAALQAGPWRVEVLVSHNGKSRLATTSISGTVDKPETGVDGGPKDLVPTPKEVDFGTISGRTPLVRSFILTNSTSRAIQIDEVLVDASSRTGYEVESECEVLEPGQGCLVKVRWTPSVQGPSQGVVGVKHNGGSRVIQVELKGIYTPSAIVSPDPWPESAPGEGLIVADKKTLEFGSSVDGAAAITVSLVNVGDKDVVLDVVRLAGSDNGLSLSRDGCRMGIVLSPTAGCALTLNWLPRREGPVIDDVQILHSGARGVLVLPVRGTAETPVGASANKTITKERDGEMITNAINTPTLDGYTITSHSPTKAIIAGPTGSRVIRDGEVVVLEGFEWVAKIVPSGVELIGEFDRILLVFDKALGPRSVRQPALASPTSDEAAAASSSSTTSTSSQ